MTTGATSGYAHPDVLVTTEWVAEHLNDPAVRIVESDEDILLYEIGHVPGAVKLDWHTDLQNPVERDFVDRAGFEALMSKAGIANDTTVVFYGDRNNWYACYTFWLFKYYGHGDCRIMDGGRAKWEGEGRPYSNAAPTYPATTYTAQEPDASIRAFRDDVLTLVNSGSGQLVDVRSPQEYTGERTHMPDYPQEGTLRGGHIPGARSVPWARAAEADGRFKAADALRAIYETEIGLSRGEDVITYCRIGERSSHTWFVLTYLLGFEHVRNYDGSWTEWGNAVRAPITTGDQP
jgi:thiosulfate/3-mercaptopyruvate sulfurtransferase